MDDTQDRLADQERAKEGKNDQSRATTEKKDKISSINLNKVSAFIWHSTIMSKVIVA